MQPHRRQPTRLRHPCDSQGKNTGVGGHFFLQCMKVKSESEVAQLCPALRDHMDCSLPGSLSMGFSRQEYWSGLPFPSPKCVLVHFKFHILLIYLLLCSIPSEKAMAPHSSTLAWKIPRMEEPGRLQSLGSQRVGHDWGTSLSLPLSLPLGTLSFCFVDGFLCCTDYVVMYTWTLNTSADE